MSFLHPPSGMCKGFYISRVCIASALHGYHRALGTYIYCEWWKATLTDQCGNLREHMTEWDVRLPDLASPSTVTRNRFTAVGWPGPGGSGVTWAGARGEGRG
jgi:hypothetical protein